MHLAQLHYNVKQLVLVPSSVVVREHIFRIQPQWQTYRIF